MVRKRSEGGQAALFLVFGLLVFGVGAMGLAIDGSHLYAERQMAQAAADSAAQAAIRSVYTGTYANGSSQAFSGGLPTFTCGASDARTPCYYAQTMNGFNSAGDAVTIDEPTAAQVGVSSTVLAASSPNLLRVTVARQVPTTFFKFISSFTPTVQASATGAIVSVTSPVPILVTHPWLPGSLSLQGSGSSAKITISGGPSQSIQINSNASSTVSLKGNPKIDLSNAGPSGTGGSFGSWGGPSPYYNGSSSSTCSTGCLLSVGSSGQYISPSYPITDPLSGVPAPLASNLTNAHAPVALSNGAYGCPANPPKACELYFPGIYSSTNVGSISVKNQTAVFAPGIYYMNGVDFTNGANGDMQMASGLTDSSTTITVTGGTVAPGGVTSCCGTGQGWNGTAPTSGGGMLVYMTGPSSTRVNGCTPPAGFADQLGTIDFSANSNITLYGSANSSAYKGIFLFVDRNAASASEVLSGGGSVIVSGNIYAPETVAQMGATSATTCGQFQTLSFGGNSGSTTTITGEIIVSAISLSGTPAITMNLSSTGVTPVTQIAMVQ